MSNQSKFKQNLRSVTVILFMLLFVRVANAQNDTFTPLGLKTGTPPGSYPASDIDTINLFNGKVNVRIPLVGREGRGQASTETTLTWDSPMRWQVYKSYDLNGNPTYGAGVAGNRPDGTSSYGYHTGEYSVYAQGVGTGFANWCAEGLYVWGEKSLTRLYWVEPDGTDHEMRDVLTNGQPLPTGGCWAAGPNRGKVFVSTDGSGVTFVSDQPIRDGIYVNMEYPWGVDLKGWLLLKDGRRIRISYESDHGLRDRNGNRLPVNFDPWVPFVLDGFGRTMTSGIGTAAECGALVPGATACSYRSYKGFGSAERRIYFFSDQNYRLSKIFLPNGRSYTLYFNNFEDLIRIDLPSGGSIEYDFDAGLSGNPGPPSNPTWPNGLYGDSGLNDAHFYRRLVERRVYREGHVLESRQTFSKPESSHTNTVGYVEKKNYDGNGTLLNIERHYFYGNAEASFWLQPTQYSSWKDGLEYRTETYDASGNLLRTVNTSWEQRAPVSWWTGSPDDAPSNDPRISQVTVILENGQQHTTSYQYDPTVPYNSLTDVIERDYNLNILRHTKTTYLKTLNGVDYAGLNVQSGASLHMRNLPLQEQIFGWGGAEDSRTVYEYDNYNSDANHAPLIARANISGFDPAFTTAYLTRGNVTATTRYLLSGGTVTGSVTSYTHYDVAGNVVKSIDARGNASTFDYTDRFGSPDTEARNNTSPTELSTPGKQAWAYPTLVTNALGHTTYTQIDFYTGLTVNVEDANGIVSSVAYADPMERPTQAIAAANNPTLKNQVSYSYDDANRIETTMKDRTAYGDNLRKTQVIFDGLGRHIETKVYENATDYISTKKNSFGLMTRESNPYRPLQGENLLWTTTLYDALGRAVSITTPDNAVTSIAYSGNAKTITDPAGKKRKTISDSIDRIARVYEDPDGLNYETIYGYNGLGRLVAVNQASLQQPLRTFVYDTLGQLLSVTNPESGTTTFKYDEVGNLLVKTDARTVSTHYSYDALNRPTRRWYNTSNATTATTHNSPALPATVGTTNEVKYFYDSQALPANAPAFTRGPSAGSLVAVTYGTSSSAGDYFGRDAIGRESLKIQQLGGINYQMSLSYNSVGDVETLVYPSGHTVNYTYDDVGRLTNLAGNLGDGTGRTYSSGILYASFGGIAKEQFGTATPIYNKLRYNNRNQLAEILASTSYTGPADLTWNRGKIINHYSDLCAGACTPTSSMTDNNGNLKKQEVFIPNNEALPTTSYSMRWQQYNYDALNRLDWAREVIDGGAEQWKQAFTYDRWGNRRINTGVTYGAGINNKNFEKHDYTNRLYAPGDLALPDASRQIRYDAAGNQIKDTYSGYGTAVFDGDNRITTITDASAGSTTYAYSADGQRVRRTIVGVETWQVHGFNGELVAEYAASGSPASPQKEYGYRNGQLLITANGSTGTPINFALNKTATQSSTTWSAPPSRAVDGNTDGAWNSGSVTHTDYDLHGWWQVDLAQVQSINTIRVWNRADYTERLASFYVFVSDVPFTSTDLTTTQNQAGVSSYYTSGECGFPTELSINRTGRYVRVQLAGQNNLHIAEVQVLGFNPPPNLALNKPATQSSTHSSGAAASRAVDGNTSGVFTNNSVTHTLLDLNAWWEVDLGQVQSIGAIKVWNRAELPERLSNFYVFVSDVPFTSTSLTTTMNQAGVSGYYTAGNCGFPSELPIYRTGRYVRVQLGGTNYLSIAEVQVFAGPSSPPVQWLISDHLGSPRMVFDQTGSLASTKRHDFLPFGEELGAGIGGRSATQGYKPDTTRQRFTGYEADAETGLYYARARYQSSIQGRFTSPDPLLASGQIFRPQSWNRYSYALNQPLVRTDPSGLQSKGQGAKDKDIKETDDEPADVVVINIHTWAASGERLTDDQLAGQRAMRVGLPNGAAQPLPTNTGGTVASVDGIQDTNNALNAMGNVASIFQYRYLSDDATKWKGKNGKWNSMSWGGNQHTGARSVFSTRGLAFRALSRTTFVLSTAVSMYQLYQAYQEGNTAAGIKAGVDIAMGIIGTFGGPIGAGVATAYFVVDYFVGWDTIGRAAVNLVSSSNEAGP